MNELIAIFAATSLGALGIAAFVVVNVVRMYSQMVKANMSVSEGAANYSHVLEAHVAARVAVINETLAKPARPEQPRPQVQKIGDDPDSYQDEPRFVDELRAEQYESENHPNDRFRRDLPSDGMPVQR